MAHQGSRRRPSSLDFEAYSQIKFPGNPFTSNWQRTLHILDTDSGVLVVRHRNKWKYVIELRSATVSTQQYNSAIPNCLFIQFENKEIAIHFENSGDLETWREQILRTKANKASIAKHNFKPAIVAFERFYQYLSEENVRFLLLFFLSSCLFFFFHPLDRSHLLVLLLLVAA